MAIKVVAILTPLPGQERALRERLQAMVPLTRAEPGNLRYDLWQEPDGQRRFVLDELYADEAAVAAHRAAPYFAEYLAALPVLAGDGGRVAAAAVPVEVQA